MLSIEREVPCTVGSKYSNGIMVSNMHLKDLMVVVYNCFFAETCPATARHRDVILHAVYNDGEQDL